MDEVVEAVEKAKKEWDEAYAKTQAHIKAIENYGKSREEKEKSSNSLQRLNGLAQDGLNLLNSLHLKLDLLAPQLPTSDQVQSAQSLLQSWKKECNNLRLSLRNANLQAKANMRKAAQEERELLLGGGEESTIRRRNLQTKAGMTSAAESITESLRRTRQLMVQEVERNASTLMTFGRSYVICLSSLFLFLCVALDESTGVLRKAESEYKGHRSLLMRTRNLLSTMQRQDIIDRVILVLGLILFSCAVLYVVSKRIGLLKLQRQVTAAIKAGMARQPEIRPGAAEDGVNLAQVYRDNAAPNMEVPLQRPMHDEL
ncbi:vesicle transport protein sec20 [Citrus sinensis]|uniref:Vesicle transport protein sec20 n=1 Tax=Citrus sinensis TaxID=2711 RepID=A0ACB8I3N3_CITSI|nr:vesicle transport protein sec20 [Citrus sinensis]